MQASDGQQQRTAAPISPSGHITPGRPGRSAQDNGCARAGHRGGGLGSPLLAYLAAAGTGTIGIVDFDAIDETNLHRQILFKGSETGTLKTVAAEK
ncbi:MAG: HesA/MoeB/ThiF family protein, partial [Bacteroidota bacterium]